jgi:hypothetical protein
MFSTYPNAAGRPQAMSFPAGLGLSIDPYDEGSSRMSNQPRVEERAATPYIGTRDRVTGEADFRRAVDRGFPRLFGWLGENGVAPAGPPFIRYLELDGQNEPVEIELGVPAQPVKDLDGGLYAGSLPAGRYATLLSRGAVQQHERARPRGGPHGAPAACRFSSCSLDA